LILQTNKKTDYDEERLPFFLLEATVNRDWRETSFFENLVKLDGVLNALHKDNDLVEHEGIEQVSEFSDLLIVFQLHVELLKPVQSQFTFVIDEDLELVLHELSANVLDIGSHCCWKHHHLLWVGCAHEDWLYITAHV